MILWRIINSNPIGENYEIASEKSKQNKKLPMKYSVEESSIRDILQKQSEKLGDYINNLDALLEIRTEKSRGVRGSICEVYDLNLQNKILRINDKDYDWYITDKHQELNIFKVVGIYKKNDKDKNKCYLLGKTDEKPFLIRLDNKYIETQGDVKERYDNYLNNVIPMMVMLWTVIISMVDGKVDTLTPVERRLIENQTKLEQIIKQTNKW
jgi:hypothetical protein